MEKYSNYNLTAMLKLNFTLQPMNASSSSASFVTFVKTLIRFHNSIKLHKPANKIQITVCV